MFDLLVDPDRFFKQRIGRDGLLGPSMVVASAGIVSIASPLVILEALVRSVNGELGFFVIGYLIGVIGTFFGPFLEWVLLSLGFYALSSRFDAHGELRQLVSLAGWGFLPAVIGGIGLVLAMLHAVSQINPPQDPAAVMKYIGTIQATPIVELGMWLGVVFTVWSGFLWVFAVKHARGIPVRHAVLCVALPVAVTVAWRLIHLL